MATNYPPQWDYKVDQSGDEDILRVKLNNAMDAKQWVKEFGTLNACKWIVGDKYKQRATSQRYESHQRWLCQHSSYKKKEGSQRSTGCKATVDVLIKLVTRNTKRADSYLKLSPPLRAVVKISMKHNHPTDTAESLRLLRPSDTTKATFEEYFNNGMSASEAHRFHEDILQANDSTPEMLANASMNPTMNTISFWHMRHRKANLGNSDDPLAKLADRRELYEGEGVLVKTAHVADCWAILIVTPIMKRAQSLSESSEIIFIDSTSSCKRNQLTTTIMLTATKAGAIPIAVLVHNSLTSEGYKTAFGLLVENCPQCFGGNTAPRVFMTDDLRAEKDALRATWSSASQLLCHFHVCKAEWSWLISMTRKEDRQRLMHAFKKVMKAESQEDLVSAVHDAYQEGGSDYLNFSKRLEHYLERKEEWVLMFRLDDSYTHNHNTNDFAEACIRILKDIILTRTKAYSIVALCDFIISVFESYLATRVTTVAYGRVAGPNNMYEKLCGRMADCDITRVYEVSPTIFTVQSQSKTLIYEVDVELGFCFCPSGRQGAFCEHQAFLYHHLQLPFPSGPPVTSLQRHSLCQLALGEHCPPQTFFVPQASDCVEGQPQLCVLVKLEAVNGTIDEPLPAPSQPDETEREAQAKEALRGELQRLDDMQVQDSMSYVIALESLTAQLKKVTNENQLVSFVSGCKGLALNQTRRGGAKHVQPKAMAGRPTRGSKRVAAGRPTNKAPKKKAKKNS